MISAKNSNPIKLEKLFLNVIKECRIIALVTIRFSLANFQNLD